MAFCTACGTQLPNNARFCPSCGAAAGDATAAARAADPAPGNAERPAGFAEPGRGGGAARWILPIVIVIAAVVIGLMLFRGKADQPAGGTPSESGQVAGQAGQSTEENAPSAGSSAGASSGTIMSAAALDGAFSRDPAAASATYPGPVRVSGVIASMVQPGPTPALSLEGRTRFNYMVVNFPAGYRERLAPLAKGQFIQLSCSRVRGLAGTTILDGCQLD
ncbi:zinc ribbon domain-containing protein [Sphingomonas mucosissima]|uniref:Zinc-ribbon domain-containing protein n=1 Tax=Sphingomonas mucosissima TaxID=370959 RepID=A0A245ZT04_9SPHN|nr:zinc ribbon domain-containing protein [Sphingomonas mucosissima]OWK32875.1 hypothetical protein SPMU_12170 [Sphingomonas mucosissima]